MHATTADPPSAAGAPPTRADRWLALCLFGAALALFSLTFQERLYGDASMLISTYGRGEVTYHPLHWLLFRGARALGFGLIGSLELATAVPAACAPALLFLALRRFGASRAAALVATGLGTFDVSTYFFSTTIEVHGIQIAGAAAALLVLAHLPGRSPLRGLGLAALAAAALAGTHTTGVLILPAVGLFYFVSLFESGMPPARARRLILGVSTAGAAIGYAIVWNYCRVQGTTLRQLFGWLFLPTPPAARLEFAVLWFFLPMGVLTLLLPFALVRDALSARARLAILLAWTLPMLVIISAMLDIPEEGAYFLALVPAVCWRVAPLLDAVRARVPPVAFAVLGVVLVATQAGLAIDYQRGKDLPEEKLPAEQQEWLAACREVTDERGMYVTLDPVHSDLVMRYTRMQSLNPSDKLAMPWEQLEPYALAFNSHWKAQTELGEPLYLGWDYVQAAERYPNIAHALEAMRRDFTFEEVELGPFKALRGSVAP